jgi:hypothetical protein
VEDCGRVVALHMLAERLNHTVHNVPDYVAWLREHDA